ncbi:2'-5' RNA ligase family protein [Mucilaginibacter ginkgonis]|uniref:2'-5' RNA ligase family protein n=1 Tax=Mucilaginibacter ginkgonis TaxID=2682091 RepID=A0A7T7FDN5_9SPHI|nr:2'-5' RNA ligase family protein [Mucilaginibacter ginkgonis]QQL51422.1 2'-5' RNA ligase family protein [Mucilaginibacter ginkgonis]
MTLTISDEAQAYFNTLRKQHFPPERNFLGAHLTLFHQLPADEPSIVGQLKELALMTQPFAMLVEAPVSIGNGVAFKIKSGQLAAIHARLQQSWQQWLIPQDRHKLHPHITIQNKVTADVVKTLLTQIDAGFAPFEITATGFALWEYLGGPWRFVQGFEFK